MEYIDEASFSLDLLRLLPPRFRRMCRRRKLGKPTYYNAEEDDEFGPQGCAFPLEENTDPDEEIPGGRDVVLDYYGYDWSVGK